MDFLGDIGGVYETLAKSAFFLCGGFTSFYAVMAFIPNLYTCISKKDKLFEGNLDVPNKISLSILEKLYIYITQFSFLSKLLFIKKLVSKKKSNEIKVIK